MSRILATGAAGLLGRFGVDGFRAHGRTMRAFGRRRLVLDHFSRTKGV